MTVAVAGDAFGGSRRLLDDVQPPAGLEPALSHLGEQRLAIPHRILSEPVDGLNWSRYPVLGGDPDVRASYAGWLDRCCSIDEARRAGRVDTEPMPGAKHAVASTLMLAAHNTSFPVIAMPDPCYPTYVAAARMCGAVFSDTESIRRILQPRSKRVSTERES